MPSARRGMLSVTGKVDRAFCVNTNCSTELHQIKTVEIHDFVPGTHKVADELFLSIFGRVDFGDGTKLRVRTKDQINRCRRPFELAGLAIKPFVDAVGLR